MCNITIQSEGRRHYLMGAPFAVKDRLRSAGCKWDADRRAWWTGKRALAEQLAAACSETAAVSGGERTAEALRDDDEIAGKARYKGREYLLVWEGPTKRGRAAKLAFNDGSKVFWAAAGEYQITKRYEERQDRWGRWSGMTFGRLKRLREEHAEAKRTGVDTSYRAYKEAIEMAEDMDSFDEARRLERLGFAGWVAEQKAGRS